MRGGGVAQQRHAQFVFTKVFDSVFVITKVVGSEPRAQATFLGDSTFFSTKVADTTSRLH
jgi:hypothetical protein